MSDKGFEIDVLVAGLVSMLAVGKGVVVAMPEGMFVLCKTEELLRCIPADQVVEDIGENDHGRVISFTELPEDPNESNMINEWKV